MKKCTSVIILITDIEKTEANISNYVILQFEIKILKILLQVCIHWVLYTF